MCKGVCGKKVGKAKVGTGYPSDSSSLEIGRDSLSEERVKKIKHFGHASVTSQH
jgi:hypothetical protein